jgi:dTDP-glucose 4,6-dehydratase
VEHKTVLIAGVAGFIGSHLATYLLDQGHTVIGVDNFVTGSHNNIDILSKNPQFHFIHHDITIPLSVKEKIHTIYDLACPASPIDFKKLSVEIIKVNSYGVYNLLELAQEKGAVFLFSSTSEVYGDPTESPQKETYNGNVNINGTRSVYDEGKRFAESMIMAFYRKYNAKTRIARIFNTYGENMRIDDGRIIPAFVSQALQNKDITILSDGKQTRCLQYISDLINGLTRLANSNVSTPVNLGNPHEMTVQQIAEVILQLTNSKSKITYHPKAENDPLQRLPDISKAQQLLDWKPQIDLESGLNKTISWFKTQLHLS